ncbi:MAG: glycosyltransferase family 9 protein [Synechococcales cyanobacterium M58_A2018_015]|nr:glycosyltransferase family 9 protein [Synechococcales cyanobacterium M58_A2018_015]
MPHSNSSSASWRIAIVRALPGLGDMLCLVPTLRALRAAFPMAEITLIGLPGIKTLMQRFRPYIDGWLEFPGYPGIPEVPLLPSRTMEFLAQVQQTPFDLALQLHGSGSYINSFTLLLGAKQTAGFFPVGQACPAELFLPYPDQTSEIWRNLRLIEWLGIPLQGDALEFPVYESDRQEACALIQRYGLQPDRYLCLHPGASISSRRWDAQHFARVGKALATQGWQIVLTGSQSERKLTEAVAQRMTTPSINLAGQTSLGGMAALLSQARLLIANDTGVSHLAAALAVNSVVIFSDSDPQRWGPLDRQRHAVLVRPAPDAVLAAAHQRLQGVAYAR